MFSILHCADLHLEASFATSGLPPSVGNWRRRDLQAALDRILDLAREHEVDAVTIGGDLYEHVYSLPDTAEFLREAFARIAPTRVFIVAGEHDPYTENSLYALSAWPKNVTVMPPGQLSRHELAPGLWLWGASYAAGAEARILDGFRVEGEGSHLLLLHAAEGGAGAEGPFRVTGAGLRKAGFQLALLGHEHCGRRGTQGTTHYLYPGSPEPLRADDARGDHLVAIVTVEDGVCTPSVLPIGTWRYPDLRVDLSGSGTTEEAAALVRLTLREAGAVDERSVCRVTLTGSRRFDLDMAALASLVETRAWVQYDAGESLPSGLQQLANEGTLRGQFARRLQSRLAGASAAERALTLNALNQGLRALEGRQVRSHESS